MAINESTGFGMGPLNRSGVMPQTHAMGPLQQNMQTNQPMGGMFGSPPTQMSQMSPQLGQMPQMPGLRGPLR